MASVMAASTPVGKLVNFEPTENIQTPKLLRNINCSPDKKSHSLKQKDGKQSPNLVNNVKKRKPMSPKHTSLNETTKKRKLVCDTSSVFDNEVKQLLEDKNSSKVSIKTRNEYKRTIENSSMNNTIEKDSELNCTAKKIKIANKSSKINVTAKNTNNRNSEPIEESNSRLSSKPSFVKRKLYSAISDYTDSDTIQEKSFLDTNKVINIYDPKRNSLKTKCIDSDQNNCEQIVPSSETSNCKIDKNKIIHKEYSLRKSKKKNIEYFGGNNCEISPIVNSNLKENIISLLKDINTCSNDDQNEKCKDNLNKNDTETDNFDNIFISDVEKKNPKSKLSKRIKKKENSKIKTITKKSINVGKEEKKNKSFNKDKKSKLKNCKNVSSTKIKTKYKESVKKLNKSLKKVQDQQSHNISRDRISKKQKKTLVNQQDSDIEDHKGVYMHCNSQLNKNMKRNFQKNYNYEKCYPRSHIENYQNCNKSHSMNRKCSRYFQNASQCYENYDRHVNKSLRKNFANPDFQINKYFKPDSTMPLNSISPFFKTSNSTIQNITNNNSTVSHNLTNVDQCLIFNEEVCGKSRTNKMNYNNALCGTSQMLRYKNKNINMFDALPVHSNDYSVNSNRMLHLNKYNHLENHQIEFGNPVLSRQSIIQNREIHVINKKSIISRPDRKTSYLDNPVSNSSFKPLLQNNYMPQYNNDSNVTLKRVSGMSHFKNSLNHMSNEQLGNVNNFRQWNRNNESFSRRNIKKSPNSKSLHFDNNFKRDMLLNYGTNQDPFQNCFNYEEIDGENLNLINIREPSTSYRYSKIPFCDNYTSKNVALMSTHDDIFVKPISYKKSHIRTNLQNSSAFKSYTSINNLPSNFNNNQGKIFENRINKDMIEYGLLQNDFQKYSDGEATDIENIVLSDINEPSTSTRILSKRTSNNHTLKNLPHHTSVSDNVFIKPIDYGKADVRCNLQSSPILKSHQNVSSLHSKFNNDHRKGIENRINKDVIENHSTQNDIQKYSDYDEIDIDNRVTDLNEPSISTRITKEISLDNYSSLKNLSHPIPINDDVFPKTIDHGKTDVKIKTLVFDDTIKKNKSCIPATLSVNIDSSKNKCNSNGSSEHNLEHTVIKVTKPDELNNSDSDDWISVQKPPMNYSPWRYLIK